jgi:hypothetical protein
VAHTDRTYRTPRPHRVVTFIDHNADGTVDTLAVTQEFGRRAGLHTHKSQTTYARRSGNRIDRHATRRQLRSVDPDGVELRQARARSIWTTR